MSFPLLLVTRPAEAAEAVVAAAQGAGFQCLVAPLLQIQTLDATPLDGSFDALLFTSPQGPPNALGWMARFGHLPAYAVGAATARAASACGFDIVATGDRDATRIVADAAADGRFALLHLGGEDVADVALPPGVRLTRVPVYRAVLADALPEPARCALAEGRVLATLLYSARAANRFAGLVGEAGLCRADLRLLCLSPAVAGAAGPGWRAIGVAEMPTTAALLAAAGAMWQNGRNG